METPTGRTGKDEPTVVVGGSGALGATIAERLVDDGRDVVLVDRRNPGSTSREGLLVLQADPLVDDLPAALIGSGPIVLTGGSDQPDAVRAWQVVLDTVLPTARLLPALVGRDVTLLSGLVVAGREPAAHLPWTDEQLLDWAYRAAELAREPCPPWRAARLCGRLADADPSGAAVRSLAVRALELLVGSAVPSPLLTVHRFGEILDAAPRGRVTRLVRRAEVGLPLTATDERVTLIGMDDVAAAVVRGGPVGGLDAGTEGPLEQLVRAAVRSPTGPGLAAGPPMPVVVPPRPELPDVVAERVQAALWSGALKDGVWGPALTAAIRDELQLDEDRAVLLTSSGSAALRLALVAAAGRAAPGDVAVLPSFTFAATGEVAAQLGYRLRFCDVQPDTWTLDADHLCSLLAPGDVRVVIGVDTLGAPLDYEAVRALCHRYGAALVADSAPSFGARHQGRPVGGQADAHSFSMSFAKVVSAAGGGGAVVLPAESLRRLRRPVDWVRSTPMGEVNAAVALDQFGRLEHLAARRRAVAEVLAELARVVPRVVPQRAAPGDRHAWVHWVARFEDVDRDRLAKGLDSHGIGSKPYYAPVLHHLDWGSQAEQAGPLPVTELLGREALALPMSSELTVADAERVLCTVLTVLDELGLRDPWR